MGIGFFMLLLLHHWYEWFHEVSPVFRSKHVSSQQGITFTLFLFWIASIKLNLQRSSSPIAATSQSNYLHPPPDDLIRTSCPLRCTAWHQMNWRQVPCTLRTKRCKGNLIHLNLWKKDPTLGTENPSLSYVWQKGTYHGSFTWEVPHPSLSLQPQRAGNSATLGIDLHKALRHLYTSPHICLEPWERLIWVIMTPLLLRNLADALKFAWVLILFPADVRVSSVICNHIMGPYV